MENTLACSRITAPAVLIIEDQLGYRELISEAIAELLFEVSVWSAKDGLEAWDLLSQTSACEHIVQRPSLVIADLNMPRSSGLDFLERLKKNESLKTIPVIIFSTSTDEADILRCYQAEANCFVTKPTDINTFFKVVQNIVIFWLTVASLPPRL